MRIFCFLAAALFSLFIAGDLAAQSVSAEPNFGSLALEEGFVPDPQAVSVTSGGTIDVGIGGCSYGYVSDAPDIDLYYTTSGGSDLYFYVVGAGDTTLLINTPNGTWVCDDDGYGDGDPILYMRNAPGGLYNVWVGSYSNDFHDATLYVSEIDPRSGSSAVLTPDYSLDPTYGSETLDEGFLPDPYTVDLVAGGVIDLNMGECTYGYIAQAPDFDLYYQTSGTSTLYVYALSEYDTTLFINLPDGNWLCNDDGYTGSNPLIILPQAANGLYDIWVGSYDGGTAGATLYISEVDPR